MLERFRMLRKICSFAMRNVMGTITHVSTREQVAALTFDDGPHPEFTPRLLDILERHQARATFFMVGKLAHRYRRLVEKIARAGHDIGNHSWDHPSFPLITRRQRRQQILACEKAIAPYGQRLFRPPYGHQSTASRFDVFSLGYKVVNWNVAAEDWLDHDADWMVKRIISGIRPGSVILLHDGLYTFTKDRYAYREPTLKAVSRLLERVGNQFRFVTITELLKQGRPQHRNWYQKVNQDWLNELKVGAI